MSHVIDSRNPAVYAALERFLKEVTWTAASTMRLRLEQPTDYAGDDIFAAKPEAVARFVTGYALEEDTSLCDALVTEIARALSIESAVS